MVLRPWPSPFAGAERWTSTSSKSVWLLQLRHRGHSKWLRNLEALPLHSARQSAQAFVVCLRYVQAGSNGKPRTSVDRAPKREPLLRVARRHCDERSRRSRVHCLSVSQISEISAVLASLGRCSPGCAAVRHSAAEQKALGPLPLRTPRAWAQ